MKHLKQAIATFALTVALVGAAFAQGEGGAGKYFESQITMTSPSGAIVQKKMDQAMLDMMMKDATPMMSGVVMMMHEGKMYTMTDHKMPNGKMMSEIVAGN